jgi:hypothetical protein
MKITLQAKFNKGEQLVLNPEELIERYFFGIPICSQDGREMSYDTIKNYILSAQREVENLLYIKLFPQIIRESSNYILEEWGSWNYVKTSYQIKTPLQLEGRFNGISQIIYPSSWLNVRAATSSVDRDRETLFRNMYVVPSGTTGNPVVNGITYNGVVPFVGLLGYRYTPNYWHSTYETGFEVIPVELIDLIGKLASIPLLSILGDIYLGIGMSSYSISLDGLSQSTSLLKSAESGIFGARIKQYYRDIFGDQMKTKGAISMLEAKYKAINFDVV